MDNRKIAATIFGLLLIVGAYFGAKAIIASKTAPKPKPKRVVKTVFVDTVQKTNIPIVINANGTLMAKRRVEVFAEVQGVFKGTNTLFKTGQSYVKGQTLINIDASEHYANVQSAKSNYYNLLTATLPDLRLDYPDFFKKWENYVSSFNMQKPTPALPQFSNEKEKFFITGKGVLSSYYNVKNLEQRLAKYKIVAPFKGVLASALVTEGTLVRTGQKLGEFIETGVYELEVAISKTYADYLVVGKTVALNNLEKTKFYEGVVTRVNARVDQETQTITTFIEVKGENLKEGQYLEALVTAKNQPNAIEIDRSLLLENNEIYTVQDSILTTIKVTPVYYTNKSVVLTNVPNGTPIVSKPLAGAYPGMLVKIFDQTAKPAM